MITQAFSVRYKIKNIMSLVVIMGMILIQPPLRSSYARGPQVRSGKLLNSFKNVHIYQFLMQIFQLIPSPLMEMQLHWIISINIRSLELSS